MSRYTRTYSRRGGGGFSATNIQFNKLLNDRPSAAKSAGRIGKWGVTSFTSLRSTHINGQEVPRKTRGEGRPRGRPPLNTRTNSLKRSPLKDPFSFDASVGSSPPSQSSSGSDGISRPKKFFKTRPIDTVGSVQQYKSPHSTKGRGRGRGRPPTRTTRSVVSKENELNYNPDNDTSQESLESLKRRIYGSALGYDYKDPFEVDKVDSEVDHGIEDSLEKLSDSHTEDQSDEKPPLSDLHTEDQSDDKPPPIRLRIFKNKEVSSKVHDNEQYSSMVVGDEEEEEVDEPSDSDDVEMGDEAPTESQSVVSVPCTKPSSKEEEVEGCLNLSQSTITISSQTTCSVNYLSDSQCQSSPLNLSSGHSQRQRDSAPSDSYFYSGESCTKSSSQLVTDSSQTQENFYHETPSDEQLQQQQFDAEKLVQAENLLQETAMDFSSVSNMLNDRSKARAAVLLNDWGGEGSREGSSSPKGSSVHSDIISGSQSQLSGGDSDSPVPQMEAAATSKLLKKGSIFKSRSVASNGEKKRIALYKHKWHDDAEKEAKAKPVVNSSQSSSSQPDVFEDFGEFENAKLTRVTTWPLSKQDSPVGLSDEGDLITSVKCSKKVKDYYTVVRNVKKAHQIQESGEFQEFNDDVDYILDALQPNNPISTRCLSGVSLAMKCMVPAFRMHLRAHGTVSKFFSALKDAPGDPSLALCTAAIMFALSQDRLNMDLTRESLELMLNLLDTESRIEDTKSDALTERELEKNKQKVRELCEEMQKKGHAKQLNLDKIMAANLAMETLLSLTSRNAGEWFKEELRDLGGLDHIIRTMLECSNYIDREMRDWMDHVLDKLKKVDRCLRVLENVTNQNEDNQRYLLRYSGGVLVSILMKLYQLCDQEVPLYPVMDIMDKESVGVILRETLFSTIKVLINLTHDFHSSSHGSTIIGLQEGIFDITLHCLLQIPNYLVENKRFDILVLSLCLLINMLENNPVNRDSFIKLLAPPEFGFHGSRKFAYQTLIEMFFAKEEHARVEEEKTDDLLDGKKDSEEDKEESDKQKTQEEFIEETVAKLLQKAGRHMEDTLISAYIALLLGYAMFDNKKNQTLLRSYMPNENFVPFVNVLKKLLNFMTLTSGALGSSRGIKATERIIKFLEDCDAPPPETMNASTSGIDTPDVSLTSNDEDSFQDSFGWME